MPGVRPQLIFFNILGSSDVLDDDCLHLRWLDPAGYWRLSSYLVMVGTSYILVSFLERPIMLLTAVRELGNSSVVNGCNLIVFSVISCG